MTEVVGIRFKKAGKVYYFDPDGHIFEDGSYAIVETARGVEYGQVVKKNMLVEDTEVLITIYSDIFLFFIRNYIINFDVFTQTTSAII